MRSLAALAALVLLAACGPLEEDCDATSLPVEGEPSEFTAGPSDDGTLSISAPEACEGSLFVDAQVIVIARTGTRTLGCAEGAAEGSCVELFPFLEERLRPRLDETGLAEHGSSIGIVCAGGPSSIWVGTRTWANADPLVAAVAAVLEQDDVDGEVRVVVGGLPAICPD